MSEMGYGGDRPPAGVFPEGWSESRVSDIASQWALVVFVPPSSHVENGMTVGAAVVGGNGSMDPMQAVDALRHLADIIEARTKGRLN